MLLGFYTLHNTFQSILKAINYGYLALYSGQIEAYTSPVGLIVMVLFNAIVAICFSFRHVIDKKLFFLIVSVFVFNLCVSVLAGSRANFVSAVLILIWILMGEKKVNVARISIGFLFIISLFLTNYFASLTGARVAVEDDSSLYKKIIEDIFYNQGITMMVFNMSIREDGYPLLAYVKTIIPGSQIVFSWFSEVYNYQLSFSQHLMYKISPQLFYEGYGLAWSLLGDFYLFSFGFIFVFFFYNFIWGRVLFIVSSCFHKDSFYKGLYFCFLSSIFIINRFSISSFLVLIAFYFFYLNWLKLNGVEMKILYVITGLGGGGAEKVLVELADQMIEKGNEVKIAYLKGEVIVKPKNPEIQLVYLGLENPLNLIKAYRKYFNLINFFKPDIVHSHMVHANIFVRIFRRFHYPISRLICSAHSSNEGGKIRMLMYRWTHSLSEVTTNVSHHAASNFEKLGAVPMGKI